MLWALALGCATALIDQDGDGHSPAMGDCDDADPTVHPDADETCNNVDDDCDGTVDGADALDGSTFYMDLDGDGAPGTAIQACLPPDGASTEAPDCDDRDPRTAPGADEFCDDADNDCDGAVDEDAIDPRWFWRDADGDGYGDVEVRQAACLAPDGHVDNADDCDDADPDTNPQTAWYTDSDADGWGSDETVQSCLQPSGTVAVGGDCDDTDAWVRPEAVELCNGEDDDCDSTVDEDAIGAWRPGEATPGAYAAGQGGWTDDWLYVLGGAETGWPNDNTTILKMDPVTLTGWQVAGAMERLSINHGTALHGGTLYHFGTSGAHHFAKIDSAGDIGGWQSGTSPPSNGENPGVVVVNDRLYVFGARNALAAFAPINADGSWGTWVETTAPPSALSAATVSLVYEDRIWVIDSNEGLGIEPTTVLVAEPDPTSGHLTWTEVGEPPIRASHATRVGDLLVVAWDITTAAPEVWAAPMTGATLGTWVQLDDVPNGVNFILIGGDRLVAVGGGTTGYDGSTDVNVLDVCE